MNGKPPVNPVEKESAMTLTELDALPVGSVVGCKGIRTWEREPRSGLWVSPEDRGNPQSSERLYRGHGGCPLEFVTQN